MIKCQKCNTLYSESAKVCLYCKVPLANGVIFDESYFSFKVKEFDNEQDAENYKIKLITSDVPCAIKKIGNVYVAFVPEEAKRNAFKTNAKNEIEFNEQKVKSNSPKVTVAVVFGVLVIIISFLIYYSSIGRKLFLKDKVEEFKLVPDKPENELYVDPNIIERNGISHPEKLNPKLKPKSEPDKKK